MADHALHRSIWIISKAVFLKSVKGSHGNRKGIQTVSLLWCSTDFGL